MLLLISLPRVFFFFMLRYAVITRLLLSAISLMLIYADITLLLLLMSDCLLRDAMPLYATWPYMMPLQLPCWR